MLRLGCSLRINRARSCVAAIIAALLSMTTLMLADCRPRPVALPTNPNSDPALQRGALAYSQAQMMPLQERLSQWDANSDGILTQRRSEQAEPYGELRRNSVSHRTYRTLCVRLCDGYYFPVSFSVGRRQFARDARVCTSRCGSGARLFVYRNPGGDIRDLKDLEGRPYDKLDTAFLYRTQYLSDCKCQPDPWEAEAADRHRKYALAAAGQGEREGVLSSSTLHGTLDPVGEQDSVTEPKRPSQPPMSLRAKVDPPKNSALGMSDWRREIFRSQN
jgi:hypothetical protein